MVDWLFKNSLIVRGFNSFYSHLKSIFSLVKLLRYKFHASIIELFMKTFNNNEYNFYSHACKHYPHVRFEIEFSLHLE